MSLTPEQVRQVARLARLDVRDDEIEHYAGQLTRIFDMVEALSDAHTDGVTPMAHPLSMVQRLRPDEVTEADRREDFQAAAPAVEHGLYVVPKVIE